jgi:uncharacterized protein DUF4012
VRTVGRLLLRVAAVVFVLLVLVFSYQAIRTVMALREAKNETSQLSGEIRRNDVAAVKQTLQHIRDHSDTARAHSDNVLWDAVGVLPLVGDDVEAVQVMARAASEASRGATAPATALLEQVQGDRLRDSDGKLNLPAIADLAQPLEQMSAALQTAADDVDAIDPDALVGPLGNVTTKVQDQIDSLLSAAKGGTSVSRLLPPMLGEDGPRTYLLVVQNNAEIRSTGGLPGSLSILEADDGKLALGDQLAVDDFDVLSTPALPLTEEEKALYGDNLGENIRDANLTPDFPRAAALIDALHTRSFGSSVDGVVAVDPVVLASVLKATGSITVDGETFTSRNVVRKLLNEVYQRFETRKEQQAYFDKVAAGVFDTLINRQVEPLKVLRALGRSAADRRFLVWSSHPEEERELATRTSGGKLPRDTGDVPQVGLYLNDATAAKIEYYLDYTASIRSASCTGAGSQTLQVGMVLTSSAPRRGFELSHYITGTGAYAAKGTMRMNLRLYAPTGAQITELTANGKPVQLVTRDHDGRQVAIVTMFIKARQQVRLAAEITTRAGQSGDPELKWTPGVRNKTTGVSAVSSC